MPLPTPFANLRLPVIASPLFIVSGPELVIAQCKAGIVGSFPALNARPAAQLDEWLHRIREELSAYDRDHPDAPAAPFAVNQIVHRSNDRLDADMAMCARHKVPLVITSLGARADVNAAVHDWGGIVLHDVIDNAFARKAIEKGADGLVPVAAGAGGHAGAQSPFALMQENSRVVYRAGGAFGRDRLRPLDPGGAGDGSGFCLYRLAVDRHAGSQCQRCLQAGGGR